MNPLVSIVILSFNRKGDLLDTLSRLKHCEYSNLEVIVVDNASSDGSADAVAGQFPQVRLLRLPENIGITGFNRGMTIARGEFICVLDDDSYPAQDTLAGTVVAFASEPPDTGVIAWKILDPVTKADQTLGWPREMVTFWGCGAAIRTSVLRRLGAFHEDFFLYRNELEFSIRLRHHGTKVIYRPELIGYHRAATTHRTSDRGYQFNNRNDAFIFWHYYPMPTALNYLARIFVFSVGLSLRRRRLQVFWFIWAPFFKKWLWSRRARGKTAEFVRFIDDPMWRRQNMIQPKLTDVPGRIRRRERWY